MAIYRLQRQRHSAGSFKEQQYTAADNGSLWTTQCVYTVYADVLWPVPIDDFALLQPATRATDSFRDAVYAGLHIAYKRKKNKVCANKVLFPLENSKKVLCHNVLGLVHCHFQC